MVIKFDLLAKWLNTTKKDVVRMEAGPDSRKKESKKENLTDTAISSGFAMLTGEDSTLWL